jgi:hypothetical protein
MVTKFALPAERTYRRGMRWRLVAGLLALSPNAFADTMSSAADVRALCAALAETGPGRADVLGAVYAIALPATGFALAPYDAGRGRLPIDGARGFRGDGYELTLYGLITRAAPRGALDLAVPATAADARALAGAHEQGALRLTLWFVPAQPEGGPTCAVVHRVADDGVRMAIEPLAFELSRGDERVASGETARFAALRDEETPPPVRKPRVVVAPALLTSAGGRAPAKLARVASALEPRLLGCYRIGLAAQPALRGSFVAGVDIAADGHVAVARAELDGLGAPALASCVLAEVRAAHFPKGPERLSIPIRFGSE